MNKKEMMDNFKSIIEKSRMFDNNKKGAIDFASDLVNGKKIKTQADYGLTAKQHVTIVKQYKSFMVASKTLPSKKEEKVEEPIEVTDDDAGNTSLIQLNRKKKTAVMKWLELASDLEKEELEQKRKLSKIKEGAKLTLSEIISSLESIGEIEITEEGQEDIKGLL